MPTLRLVTHTYFANHPPIVELTINKQSYRFLIDTSYRAVQVSGLGGIHEIYEAHVKFNFAGITLHTVDIDPSIRTDVFTGVIGCDILRQFKRVIIDNERQTITFEQ